MRQTGAWRALAHAPTEDGPQVASLDMGRRRTPLAVLCALAVALTGCSEHIAGDPQPDPSVAAAHRLDTGNYNTSPREVKAVSAADSWQQEGWLIAENVTAPWDVDSTMSKKVPGTTATALIGPSQLSATAGGITLFTAAQLDAFATVPFQSGFATVASDNSTVLRIGLLRFADAAAARRASDVLAGVAGSGAAPVPAGVTTASGARMVRRTTSGSGATATTDVTLVAPRDGQLAVVGVQVRGADEKSALPLAGKALDKQYADAAGYRPTPVVSLGGTASGPSVPMDNDGIMSRTLASTRTADSMGAKLGLSPGFGLGDGWRTFKASVVESPGKTEDVMRMREYGFDLIGNTDNSQVYRLGDDTKAKAFLNDYVVPPKVSDIALPGVDNSVGRCAKVSSTRHRCAVINGRYLAVVSAPTLTQAQQAASASLSIMRSVK